MFALLGHVEVVILEMLIVLALLVMFVMLWRVDIVIWAIPKICSYSRHHKLVKISHDI